MMVKGRKKPEYIRAAFSSYKRIDKKSHLKLYAIVARNLEKPNEILGFSPHVGRCVWAQSLIYVGDEETMRRYLGKKYRKWLKTETDYSVFIVKINSKSCPIEVDLSNHLGDHYFSFTVKQSINTG